MFRQMTNNKQTSKHKLGNRQTVESAGRPSMLKLSKKQLKQQR